MSRALIISGGGIMGEVAAACIDELLKEHNYDFVAGNSTGALLTPFALLGDMSTPLQVYPKVKKEDLFSNSPFTNRGKIRIDKLIWALITGRKTIGDMRNLEKLVDESLTVEVWNKIQESGKEMVIGAVDISSDPANLVMCSNKNTWFRNFKQFMVASSCLAPVSHVARIGNEYYVDGGVMETININEALKRGYKDIDVIVLRPFRDKKHIGEPKNMIDLLRRMYDAMRYDVVYDNLNDALLSALSRDDITIRMYNLPHEITKNAMDFNQDRSSWIQIGREMARNPRVY